MRKHIGLYFCLFCFLAFYSVAVLAEEQKQNAIPAEQKPNTPPVKDRRNPFIPLVTKDGKFVNLEQNGSRKQQDIFVLEGISYDPRGVSYALIGGAVVQIGDFVEDYQVLKIEQDKIVLIKDGQTTEIIYKKGEE
ncbi:MAG: hypothetical protein MUF05_03475 [Candidatus Omnitrophica bacterium]|jgi:hypothetical protein|nr:hypothetical protein [Candidatus Omnitrophota bacterium]